MGKELPGNLSGAYWYAPAVGPFKRHTNGCRALGTAPSCDGMH